MKYCLILFFLLCKYTSAQTYFNKTIDFSSETESAHSITQLENGEIVILGAYFDHEIRENYSIQSIFLMKLDEYGNQIWLQKHADSTAVLYTGFKSLIQTNDGGFAFGGGYQELGEGIQPKYLIGKFDSLGNKEWFKTYGGEGWDTGIQAKQTWDGGFVMIGRSSSFGDPESDIYLVRTDKNGEVMWEKTYGEEFDDYANTIEVLEGRSFIIGASIGKMHNGTLRDDSYIFQTDSLGNVIWERKYNFGEDNVNCIIGSVVPTMGGDYLIKSCQGEFFEGEMTPRAYIAKIDEEGEIIWKWEVEPNNDERGFLRVRELPDTTYAFAGWFRHTNDYYRGWMGKLDKHGELIWDKDYYTATNKHQNIYDMVAAPNGDLIATGSAFNPEDVNNEESFNIWLLRVNCMGEFEPLAEGERCETIVSIKDEFLLEKNNLQLFPNPATHQVQIIWDKVESSPTQISIYNLIGEKVYSVSILDESENTHVDISTFPNGLYLVSIEEKGAILAQQKLVISK